MHRKKSRYKISEINLNTSISPQFAPTGGKMLAGKLVPTDYFEEMTDEELEELDEYFLNESIAGSLINLGQTGVYSIPKWGDLIAAIRFLWIIFNPITGLRVLVKNFTKDLSAFTDVPLGNDFLEPEGKGLTEESLTSNLKVAVDVIKNRDLYYNNPHKGETLSKIQDIQDAYDEILDSLRQAFIAFFGAVDIIANQRGFFINLGLSLVEPDDIVDYTLNKYAKMITIKFKNLEKGMKEKEEKQKFFEMLSDYANNQEDILESIVKFLKNMNSQLSEVPLVGYFFKTFKRFFKIAAETPDKLGHFDILYNVKKLERFNIVHDALTSLSEREDIKRQELGEEEATISKFVGWVLDKLFENDTDNLPLMTEIMSDYLNEDELEEDEEIDEYMTTGSVSGYSLPLGRTNKPPSETKDHIRFSEQIEYMRKLQDYHTKTTQRMK